MAFLFPKLFPFCVQDAGETAVGDGTQYPFEMTLEDAMALYWKFLSVKITDNLIFSFTTIRIGGDPSDCVAYHSFSGEFSAIGSWPNKMSNMICPPSPYFYGTVFGNPNGFLTSTLAEPIDTEGVYSLLYGSSVITKTINDEAKFYPNFSLSIATANEYDTGYSTQNNLGGRISAKIVTLKVNGNEYTTNLYAGDSSGGTLESATSLAGSIIIEKASDRIAE